MYPLNLSALVIVLLMLSTSVRAAGDDVSTLITEQGFEEAVDSVRGAIINRGYSVDYNGHIGEMLDRTAKDVGATKRIFKGAEIFSFCSAVMSRDVLEHDASDIAYCPYVIFVYEEASADEGVKIGFRHLPSGGARDQANDMLTAIIESAADGF